MIYMCRNQNDAAYNSLSYVPYWYVFMPHVVYPT